MFTLRYYQREAVEGLFNFFRDNPTGNPLVAIPTGCGKSLIIAEFIRRALTLYPATRILIAVHTKELVAQNHAELLSLWPTSPCGIYSAGLNRRDTHLPITFVSIASVAKRIADFGHTDLCIVDEAHAISHREGTLYHKAFEGIRAINPNFRIIGLTASPWRMGVGLLTDGDIFTAVSTDYTSYEKFNELVDNGFISPLLPRPLKTELPVDDVRIQAGDFVQADLQKACDKDAITRAAIAEAIPWINHENRQHILVFCTGISHSDHTRDILIEHGISAVCVHTGLPGGEKERDQNILDFKAGKVRAMVGVGVFSVGFNYKPIDAIIMLRPTLSPVFWLQALGRGTRPSPETGKVNCRVLDFARNTRNLGPINDIKIPKKRGKPGSGMTPFKICAACGCYNPTRVRFCIECQNEFPATVNVVTKASKLELIRREPKPPKPPPPPATVVTHDVSRIEFARHASKDQAKPPSLRISYICGVHIFSEWLCLEHPQPFPRHKARDAWRLMSRAEYSPPETVNEALERLGELEPPSQIRVLLNGKYPQVVGYEFGKKVEMALEDCPF